MKLITIDTGIVPDLDKDWVCVGVWLVSSPHPINFGLPSDDVHLHLCFRNALTVFKLTFDLFSFSLQTCFKISCL